MFDLEAPPTMNWAVQILTVDYLIEGTIDGSRERPAFNLVSGDARAIRVDQPQVTSTGRLDVPARPAVPWALVYGNELVAIIPRDQASLNYALRANESFKTPIPGEVYAGPYVFSGTIMSPDRKLRIVEGYTAVVLQNVTIDCLASGTSMSRLQAPYVMVLGNHKHFLVAR